MNIAVYLGSNPGRNPRYLKDAAAFGRMLASKGHTLVYGGANDGTMGELARAVKAGGGTVIGVIPDFFAARLFDGLDERHVVKTMAERRSKMIEKADGYIAFPGGPGTIEEISEVISAVRIGLFKKPCVIYSPQGYYDYLEQQYDRMVEEGFLSAEERSRFTFVETLEEAAQVLGM